MTEHDFESYVNSAVLYHELATGIKQSVRGEGVDIRRQHIADVTRFDAEAARLLDQLADAEDALYQRFKVLRAGFSVIKAQTSQNKD